MKSKQDGSADSGRRKRKRRRGATVIHVTFGAGGGRRASSAAPPPDTQGSPARTQGREPVTDLFSRREAAKLLGVSERRLRLLDRENVVSPSGRRGAKLAYTFQDLIALRATRELLAHRIRLKDVARAVGALREALPRVTRPLQELRIVGDGKRVVVRSDAGAFEPLTGQMLLDFDVGTFRQDVVRLLRPGASPGRTRTAYDLYVEASALDENAATYDRAQELYQQAIQLDPSLAIAYTNLGNIRFRRGDEQGAERLYRQAIDIDPHQPEAHYNLGYVMLERGQPRLSVSFFERAIESDPRFADAYFNLAMAFEQLGQRAPARVNWKKYLDLEPSGTWADIAREHLRGV